MSTAKPSNFRRAASGPATDPVTATEGTEQPVAENPSSTAMIEFDDPPAWSYRWEDPLNALPEVADPPLVQRVLDELERLVRAGVTGPMIHVRGEMGIGKTELGRLLKLAMPVDLVHTFIVEARDLESPADFARRVNELLSQEVPIIVMARPATMDIAGMSFARVPEATVTISTFHQDSVIYGRCLTRVAALHGLNQGQRPRLEQLCQSLPAVMQTPFFYGQLAGAIANNTSMEGSAGALALFEEALRTRLGTRAFSDATRVAVSNSPSKGVTVQGVIDRGLFIHDGYRNIFLAVATASGELDLLQLMRAPNSVPAVRMLLTQVLSESDDQVLESVVQQMSTFVSSPPEGNIPYEVYMRALLADALDQRKGCEIHAAAVREMCLDVMGDKRFEVTGAGKDSGTLARLTSEYLWHDVSDALSLVGDPRLPDLRSTPPGPQDPYYTYVDLSGVEIGSSGVVPRLDNAKPVQPYSRTIVDVGPLWVANFLCTAEQFAEFWHDPDRAAFFRGSGKRWLSREHSFRAAIESSFELTAARNFWKELQEHNRVRDVQFASGLRSILDIAKDRATGELRVSLWDEAQSDSRFSSRGKPVVGVNWWEARAFAAWWQETKISSFPSGSTVDLLTDWEWEAIRRDSFAARATPIAKQQVSSRTFPAHLRRIDHQLGHRDRDLARTSPLQPLHVGLFPSPSGEGPYDLVGNVWEWTRSKVFGKIFWREGPDTGPFAGTAWDDMDASRERDPLAAGREDEDSDNDISYRAVRGASFFSVDPDAAWHPAYRLCDPPYASYFDLGFRIAVYPPQERTT